MSSEDPRFAGIARLYGIEGLERLRAAHVAVVGIGGVGSWAAYYITPYLDCLLDRIDAVNAQTALIAWYKRRKIQITTGGAGGQIDPTMIQVCNLNRTPV